MKHPKTIRYEVAAKLTVEVDAFEIEMHKGYDRAMQIQDAEQRILALRLVSDEVASEKIAERDVTISGGALRDKIADDIEWTKLATE